MTAVVKGRIVMTKVSLFFGAGAECSYGLPSGGKFALDIFRMNTSFTKTQYESIVKVSLENKRNNILDYLNNFYEKVNLISQKLYDTTDTENRITSK